MAGAGESQAPSTQGSGPLRAGDATTQMPRLERGQGPPGEVQGPRGAHPGFPQEIDSKQRKQEGAQWEEEVSSKRKRKWEVGGDAGHPS